MEIFQISGLGSTSGYYAAGHHNKQEFATQCNNSFCLQRIDLNLVHGHKVVQGWMMQIPPVKEDIDYCYGFSHLKLDSHMVAATYFFY